MFGAQSRKAVREVFLACVPSGYGLWRMSVFDANRRPEAGRASKREKQNQPRQCRAAGDGCCVGDGGRGSDVGRCAEGLRKLGPAVSAGRWVWE